MLCLSDLQIPLKPLSAQMSRKESTADGRRVQHGWPSVSPQKELQKRMANKYRIHRYRRRAYNRSADKKHQKEQKQQQQQQTQQHSGGETGNSAE
jgi:hypothetical protein